MRKPDFLIIGAMKCGTTTLAAQVGAQTGVFITTPKEPNYFSDDSIYSKGEAWYAALFQGAQQSDICGEASTHYTKRPEYPNAVTRILETLPNARFVYMIRNPMDRLISHYIHDWSQRKLSCSVEVAIEKYPPLVNYGLYGWQIQPFVEALGTESILLTSLERLKLNPLAELERVLDHIGFEGAAVWKVEDSVRNMSSDRIRRFPLHGLLVENQIASGLRRAFVPERIRRKIRELRKTPTRPSVPKSARPQLEALFSEDKKRLARLFPNDAFLDLSYDFLE